MKLTISSLLTLVAVVPSLAAPLASDVRGVNDVDLTEPRKYYAREANDVDITEPRKYYARDTGDVDIINSVRTYFARDVDSNEAEVARQLGSHRYYIRADGQERQ